MDDLRVEAIARTCHEANRGWCEANGDGSQMPWDLAPDWQRDSAVNGVRFHLANPSAPASASHDSWMAEKAATGWVFGVRKDATLKTHPCMVPFEELPAVQQAKDRLFKGDGARVGAVAKTGLRPTGGGGRNITVRFSRPGA